MSDPVSESPPSGGSWRPLLHSHGALIAGLCVLYIPTLVRLFGGIWADSNQMHGPVVLGIGIWLLRRNAHKMQCVAVPGGNYRPLAWLLFIVGLLAYAVGRSQDVQMLEVGSVLWILTAFILLQWGAAALRVQWFGLFFMLFMVPLPANIVDLVTQPMKMLVSIGAENVLAWLGYPVGRNGVVLQVGQYMLLVADACAGLHTLLTLESMGLLYLNIVRRDSWIRNTALALLIVPISFTANIIRVIALCLITYHFGDAAGQGFLHGFAGMVLFLSALMLIIGIDSSIHWLQRRSAAVGRGGI